MSDRDRFFVGPCAKCGEVILLTAGAMTDAQIDQALSGPRECPGMHVEIGAWSSYFWPWRRWPVFGTRVEAEAAVAAMAERRLRGGLSGAVRERIQRGEVRLLPDGSVAEDAAR